jgi:hypothetical protein
MPRPHELNRRGSGARTSSSKLGGSSLSNLAAVITRGDFGWTTGIPSALNQANKQVWQKHKCPRRPCRLTRGTKKKKKDQEKKTCKPVVRDEVVGQHINYQGKKPKEKNVMQFVMQFKVVVQRADAVLQALCLESGPIRLDRGMPAEYRTDTSPAWRAGHLSGLSAPMQRCQ